MSKKTLRDDAWRIIKSALGAVDPGECVRRAVRRDGDWLKIGEKGYNLSQVRRTIVVGMGKASARMAAALEEIIGDLIAAGLVVTAQGYRVPTQYVEVVEAGHPVPDARGVLASERIAALLDGVSEEDLVIVLISGGGSALLPLPAPGITLADLQRTNELLLHSGANIQEMNAVRKHLSQLQGGQLAKRAFPARLLSLILSDVPGDPLDSIASGPTSFDPTTYADAERVLRRYGLWDRVPYTVKAHIEAGLRGEIKETPGSTDPIFARVENIIVGSGAVAAEAACREAERLGYRAFVLTTTLTGEAREAGKFFAALAQELVRHRRPIEPPALVVAAGETTVAVRGTGKGGRNQEFSLAAALGIQGLPNVVICALGTDGRDGPTDAAGGLVDGETAARIRAAGLDPEEALAQNDSYTALSAAGDLLITGPTGTNVADLYFVLAGEEEG